MQFPYFYEQSIVPGASFFILSEETSKHCIQVLRMKTGEKLQLTDGMGNLYTASIIKEDKRHCEVKLEGSVKSERASRNISIGISLLKNTSRFEWFLEKVTEIGVNEIIPLLCKRTERQQFRFDRMNGVLISAMLQSRQTWLPILHEPTSFDTIISQSPHSQKLIAFCDENKRPAIKELIITDSVQALIGPEGDFTIEEIQSSHLKNYQGITLGDTRLRTETAGVVIATLLRNL